MNLHPSIINATPMAVRRGHDVVHNHDHPHTSGGGVWGLIIVGAVLLVIAGFVALKAMMNADARADDVIVPPAPAPEADATPTSASGGNHQGAPTTDLPVL